MLIQLQKEAEVCQIGTEAAQIRLDEKRRMEREWKAIFDANPNPLSIAPYDNLQPVMFELNTILRGTGDYTLSFGTVDTSQPIVRRSISITFTADSYASARG